MNETCNRNSYFTSDDVYMCIINNNIFCNFKSDLWMCPLYCINMSLTIELSTSDWVILYWIILINRKRSCLFHQIAFLRVNFIDLPRTNSLRASVVTGKIWAHGLITNTVILHSYRKVSRECDSFEKTYRAVLLQVYHRRVYEEAVCVVCSV